MKTAVVPSSFHWIFLLSPLLNIAVAFLFSFFPRYNTFNSNHLSSYFEFLFIHYNRPVQSHLGRGAEIKNWAHFKKIFNLGLMDRKVIEVKLENNYRSSKNIIEAAASVIANNTIRIPKNMKTCRN